ncbi:MAG: glycoside hydrolase family 20 zincin-like fold domain-containing protein [Kiritimatiellia bacterium]|jgi:hexosaminidase
MSRMPSLLPQPKSLTLSEGRFCPSATPAIGIGDPSLAAEAARLASLFPGAVAGSPRPGDELSLALDPSLPPEGYALMATPRSITLIGGSPAGVFYGVQTLAQLVRQTPGGGVPCLTITDEPDFPERGVYYDVARGRVPTLESLLALVRLLASYKVNQLQLYIEHTFVFRGHPDIGRDASPLSPDDIRAIDAECRAFHIELVPSLASFGHLSSVLLSSPRYADLAEDFCRGEYRSPEAKDMPAWMLHRGWTLSPANPAIYPFLESLFDEFLPCFSSKRFNVCCDETWDLGLGQSYELCRQKGKGAVYLGHILKLRELAAKHGKSIMFWGDIIRKYPDLIPQIPKDVTVLDWGYAHDHPFDRVRDFREAGVPFLVCPSTSAYVSLFPRIPESRASIVGFARAGKANGARGLLNTDWGDGGHYNFLEYSTYGYLFGAEQSWNTGADLLGFDARFCELFLQARDPAVARALRDLGDISQLHLGPYYQSIWQHALFAPHDSPVFTAPQPVPSNFVRDGEIVTGPFSFDAACGAETRRRLASIRPVFESLAAQKNADPFGVLPYWIFAVDATDCAAHKLMAFGAGGEDTPGTREEILAELRSLRRRFITLWNARNRPSEIRITLARYDAAIDDLRPPSKERSKESR